MVSSNIAITHADSGVVTADVLDAVQISPHFVRVTIGGDDCAMAPCGLRPVVPPRGADVGRHAIRQPRRHLRHGGLPEVPDAAALDAAGDPQLHRARVPARAARARRRLRRARRRRGGRAVGRTACRSGRRSRSSTRAADSGSVEADRTLLVGDESALPAVVGILRDLPRDATGHALIELADLADRQHVDAAGGHVGALDRAPARRLGRRLALEHLRELPPPCRHGHAFAAGESKLATGARRHLVNERSCRRRTSRSAATGARTDAGPRLVMAALSYSSDPPDRSAVPGVQDLLGHHRRVGLRHADAQRLHSCIRALT